MWLLLGLDIVFACIVFYVPGWLGASCMKMGRLGALVCAPVFSILGYSVISIILALGGLSVPWYVPLGACWILSAAVAVTCRFMRTRSAVCRSVRQHGWRGFRGALLYVGVSACVALMVFGIGLDGASSVFQENDCFYHLNMVRQYLDTGMFYRAAGGFYPQAWHGVVAFCAGAVGGNVGIAVNAVNFVLVAVVFPAGMYLFLSRVVKDERIVRWGALCVPAFTAFPWGFLVFGPLYPNLLGYALLPVAMYLFVRALERRGGFVDRIVGFAPFLLACAVLGLAHPNAVFTGIALLTPYGAVEVFRAVGECLSCEETRRRSVSFASGCAFIVGVVLIWTVLFRSPLFAGVVDFVWDSYLSPKQAVTSAVLLSLTKASAPQVILAGFVLCGAVRCMYVREHRWIVAAYALAIVMYVVCVSGEGILKHYLTGFWYTDPFRVAALVALAAMPLAMFGLEAVFSVLLGLFRSAACLIVGRERFIAGVFALLFCAFVFWPSFEMPKNGHIVTGFGALEELFSQGNSLAAGANPYDLSERRFIEDVGQCVPEDAVILNIPFDGSNYAYGLDGVEMYFNGWYGFVDDGSTDSLIRTGLSDISSDKRVRDAVRATGAQYVLLLDQGSDGAGLYYLYDAAQWGGIASVDDDTPGFEVVLAQGDMRLYRIVA